MKIKQQKNIKAFLNEEFGEKRGNDLFNKQEAMLNELIKNTQNKSKNQSYTHTGFNSSISVLYGIL